MAAKAITEGVFAINKPKGHSSAQVLRDCQAAFGPSAMFSPLLALERNKRMAESKAEARRRGPHKKDLRVKMGHGGTLDPLATGILVVGVGSGTKQLQKFIGCRKTYEAVVVFGANTDTFDRVGRVTEYCGYHHITREMVEFTLNEFRGKTKQVPPIFSALKVNGMPMYEYARRGLPLPREATPRDVEVFDLEVVEWMGPGTHQHRWPSSEEQSSVKSESGDKRSHDEMDGAGRDNAPRKRLRPAKGPSTPQSQHEHSHKGRNLLPAEPSPDAPPPWRGEGPPAARIRMTVGSGFYVRSLCRDLGQAVGSGAMMAELCRVRQGPFALDVLGKCLDYDNIAQGEGVWGPQLARMLADWDARGDDGLADPEINKDAVSAHRGGAGSAPPDHAQDADIAQRGGAGSAPPDHAQDADIAHRGGAGSAPPDHAQDADIAHRGGAGSAPPDQTKDADSAHPGDAGPAPPEDIAAGSEATRRWHSPSPATAGECPHENEEVPVGRLDHEEVGSESPSSSASPSPPPCYHHHHDDEESIPAPPRPAPVPFYDPSAGSSPDNPIFVTTEDEIPSPGSSYSNPINLVRDGDEGEGSKDREDEGSKDREDEDREEEDSEDEDSEDEDSEDEEDEDSVYEEDEDEESGSGSS